jgi:hypothetical protein
MGHAADATCSGHPEHSPGPELLHARYIEVMHGARIAIIIARAL